MRTPRTLRNPLDPKGEFPLEASVYLFYLMFQAVRLRDVHYDQKLAKIGLTLHRWRILAVIRRIENCSMKDLALFSAVDRTTLTRAVDQLVAEGVVERWSSPRDRRRVNVSLSAKGEAVFVQAAGIVGEGNAKMLAGLDEDAIRGAAHVMVGIVRNLADDPFAAERLLDYSPLSSDRR